MTLKRILLFMALICSVSCDNSPSTKSNGIKVELSSPEDNSQPQLLLSKLPEISTTALSSDLKKTIKDLTYQIDQSLPNLKKTTTKILFDKTPNTPVTIWYDQDKPVKLVHGIPDISGTINGEFSYYLKGGNVWYADQIYTKYVFQDQKLIYWMNMKWEINDIPADEFAERERKVIETVETLIGLIH